jgi:hypothetical protein
VTQKKTPTKKKVTNTPLWSLMSGGREPHTPPIEHKMVPAIVGAREPFYTDRVNAAVDANDLRRLNWLTAAWCETPQASDAAGATLRSDLRMNSGLDLKVLAQ